MRIIQLVAFALVFNFLSIPAQSQDNNLYKYVAFIKGRCTKLIVDGKDFSQICSSALVNSSYKTGRGSFAAVLTNQQGMVSFSGSKDVQPSLSRYTLYIDKMLLVGSAFVTNQIYKDRIGTCEIFGNPISEISTIKCRAEAQDEPTSEVEFVTDGSKPEIVN